MLFARVLVVALVAAAVPVVADHEPEDAVAGEGSKAADGPAYGDCVRVTFPGAGAASHVLLFGEGADWDLVWVDADGAVADANGDGFVDGLFTEADESGAPPAWARGVHVCLWSSTSTDVYSWLVDDVYPRVEPVPKAGSAIFRLETYYHWGAGSLCAAGVCHDSADWRRAFLPTFD